MSNYTKQNKSRWFFLCREYVKAAKAVGTPEGNAAFVSISLQIHAQKALVPKSWTLTRPAGG